MIQKTAKKSKSAPLCFISKTKLCWWFCVRFFMLTQNKWKYTSFCHPNLFYILNTNRWNKRFAPSSTWSSIWLNWPFDFNVWCPLHVWVFRVRYYILRFVYSFNQSRKGSSFGSLKCNFHQHHKSPSCKYSILSKLIETSFFNFEYFISKPKNKFLKYFESALK